jgi:hypothetical protein
MWAVPAQAAIEYPDMVSDPPEDPFLDLSGSGGGSRLLLRFDGFVHNAGGGRAEIVGTGGLIGLQKAVVAQVYDDDVLGEVSAASPGQLLFETNDSHNHFHLMRAARYSLHDSNGEVAPAMKVGFCLADSEEVEAPPGSPTYGGSGCGSNPNVGTVTMGVSAGWRDWYPSYLAFQWVDVSDVTPGSYTLKSQVDPDDVIDEGPNEVNPLSTGVAATVPGWVAQGFADDPGGAPQTYNLAAQAFGGANQLQFKIMRGPEHGLLDEPEGQWFSGSSVTYTPEPGYSGDDSFSFAARDSGSSFPRHPFVAAACLAGDGSCLALSGPQQVFVGATAQFDAATFGGAPGLEWAVNGADGGTPELGTIDEGGVYTAPASPPPGGSVTIRATSTDTGDFDERSLSITPLPPVDPAPLPPGTTAPPEGTTAPPAGTTTNTPARLLARLSRARMFRSDGRLYVRLRAGRNGRLIVGGKVRRKRFRICSVKVQAGQSLTCRVRVPRRLGDGRVLVTARLVSGRRTLATRRASALSRVRSSGHSH